MTNASRVEFIRVLSIVLVCPAASALAQPRSPIAEQIAKAHGLDSFGQVDAIRYTFHIEAGPLKVSRSWVWEPKKDQISYDGPDNAGSPVKITYSRSQLASQSAVVKEQIDPAFFNDQYNLLFPFHLVWDTSATVQDEGIQKLPLGKGSARKVVVKYPPEGGYAPGDTWDIYVGTDDRIQALFFHRGGAVKPSTFIAPFTDYKKVGPLLLSLDHRGKADGKPARVFFTNVAVKLAGSETWTEAQQLPAG